MTTQEKKTTEVQSPLRPFPILFGNPVPMPEIAVLANTLHITEVSIVYIYFHTYHDALFFQSGMQMTNLGYEDNNGHHSPQHDYDLPPSVENVSINSTCCFRLVRYVIYQ